MFVASVDYYTENAAQLNERYRSRRADLVHGDWFAVNCAGRAPGRACDVGAGSGRDAQWLVEQGETVVAVEHSVGMRDMAAANSATQIHWVDDCLPDLSVVSLRPDRFELILVSAVWQHLQPGCRAGAVRALSELLVPRGHLVITLRHGNDSAENTLRGFFAVSGVELEEQALAVGLTLVSRHCRDDEDRPHIQWETCVFSKPV